MVLTIPSFVSTGQNLIPLFMVAMLVDVGIIAIWYFIGVLLNNRGWKGSAVGEFYQFIGTAIIAAVAIGALAMSANVFTGILGSTQLMSPSAVSTMCTNIENFNSGGALSLSGLHLLKPTDSLLAGSSTNPNLFPGICNLLSPSTGDIGGQIDYPLAASAVVLANLTNQSAVNLNSLFYIENFVFFLQWLKPQSIVCIGAIGNCEDVGEPIVTVALSYAPYTGYSAFKKVGNIVGTLTTGEVESLSLQLIVIAIMLAIWPYLFFVGLVLRATLFTRKIGGTLIAMAIGAVIFVPLLLNIEYLGLAGSASPLAAASAASATNPSGFNAASYGFSTQTDLPQASCATSNPGACTGNYILNFYVMPSYQAIANADSCWTIGLIPLSINTPIALETADVLFLGIPGVGLVSGLLSIGTLFSSSVPPVVLPYSCAPENVYHMFFQLVEAAAVGGITAYFLPVLNIIMVFAGIRGLSKLFGGDTEFAGLGKLV